jgi:5-methylcytosine-specific restriction enzyme subunit McrC
MKQQFVVSEYSDDIFIPNYELTQEERLYLAKSSIIYEKRPWEKRFYFDELKNGLRLQTQSWVGVIELEKARIVIQPKFNKGFTALLEMISFIEELPFYQWQDTDGAIGKTDLLEILVRVFLKEAEHVLKIGLVKEYITEAVNLVNLRGRVEFRQNLKQNYNLPNKVYCEYDELVTNIVDNQILLSVLSKDFGI